MADSRRLFLLSYIIYFGNIAYGSWNSNINKVSGVAQEKHMTNLASIKYLVCVVIMVSITSITYMASMSITRPV